MPTLYFTVLFVIAVVAMVGTKLWLASRQTRFVAAHRDQVPPQFSTTIPLPAHQRAADYTVDRTRLTMDGVLPDGTSIPFHPRSRAQGFNSILQTTHRQNFLVPPRRNRSFPLSELL